MPEDEGIYETADPDRGSNTRGETPDSERYRRVLQTPTNSRQHSFLIHCNYYYLSNYISIYPSLFVNEQNLSKEKKKDKNLSRTLRCCSSSLSNMECLVNYMEVTSKEKKTISGSKYFTLPHSTVILKEYVENIALKSCNIAKIFIKLLERFLKYCRNLRSKNYK